MTRYGAAVSLLRPHPAQDRNVTFKLFAPEPKTRSRSHAAEVGGKPVTPTSAARSGRPFRPERPGYEHDGLVFLAATGKRRAALLIRIAPGKHLLDHAKRLSHGHRLSADPFSTASGAHGSGGGPPKPLTRGFGAAASGPMRPSRYNRESELLSHARCRQRVPGLGQDDACPQDRARGQVPGDLPGRNQGRNGACHSGFRAGASR